MNQKRAKRLRRAISVISAGKSSTPLYADIKYTKEFERYSLDEKGKTVITEVPYQVRTLFLIKCQRADYQRLKSKDRQFQDSVMKMVEEAARVAA